MEGRYCVSRQMRRAIYAEHSLESLAERFGNRWSDANATKSVRVSAPPPLAASVSKGTDKAGLPTSLAGVSRATRGDRRGRRGATGGGSAAESILCDVRRRSRDQRPGS